MREFNIVPIIETRHAFVAHFFCTGEKCKACREETHENPVIAFPTRGVYIKRDSFGRHVVDHTTALFFNAGGLYEVDHPVDTPDHCWYLSLNDPIFADAWRQFGLEEDYLDGKAFQKSTISLSPQHWFRAAFFYRSIEDNPNALALQEYIFALLQWILPPALDGRCAEPAILKQKADRVMTARVYLAENFRENIQLTDLVEATGTSPFHLCRIFREQTGHTLHKQLVRLRLHAAMEALRDSSRSITAIAHDFGFNSHSHFSTCFQKELGMTPSFYRAHLS